MTDIDQSGYYGQIAFVPTGHWTLEANEPKFMNSDAYLCSSTSDDVAAKKLKHAIMMSDGSILCPYDSVYQLSLSTTLSDFVDVTLPDDQVPTLTFRIIYLPQNPESQSPTYTLITTKLSKRSPNSETYQRVIMKQGDLIRLQIESSLDLNCSQIGRTTQFNFNDDKQSTTLTQFHASSTSRPNLAPLFHEKNKVLLKFEADVVDNIATIILTQDGTPIGQSMFRTISYYTVTPIAKKDTTHIDGAGVLYAVNPLDDDLKTMTISCSAMNPNVILSDYVISVTVFGS